MSVLAADKLFDFSSNINVIDKAAMLTKTLSEYQSPCTKEVFFPFFFLFSLLSVCLFFFNRTQSMKAHLSRKDSSKSLIKYMAAGELEHFVLALPSYNTS